LAGELPSDRFYGLIELQKLGYDASFKDIRPQGPFSKLLRSINIRYGLKLPDLKTLLILPKYDVIVVKDNFSTLLTIACRIFNKKIVYVDALFSIPRNILRKIVIKINLHFSSGIVLYSRKQMELWSKLLNVPSSRFKVLPYTIDVSFYKNSISGKTTYEPFVLSVGRDQARDYSTLVEAMDGLGVNLKIVSLHYLLKDINLNNTWFELLEYISYERLFQLYTEALFVVLPIKKWGTEYPSGIRGLLEALELGKGVIASRSLLLEEYVRQDEGVLYVEPENVKELRQKIMSLLENPDDRIRLETRGREVVKKNYNMDVFAIAFGNYLSSLFEDTMKGISPKKL